MPNIITTTPYPDSTFDTIISFETIEHVTDYQLFMSHLDQMLRPGGILILSSPFGLGRGKPCAYPFHVQEFNQEEFIELFNKFSNIEIYHQRGVTIEPPRPEVQYTMGVALCRK